MKRICAFFLAVAACVVFSGCTYGQTGIEALLKPPRMSDQQSEIYAALENSTEKNLTLKYPRKGEFTSAFVINNMDDEPSQEALVFYELQGSTESTMPLRISVLDQQGGEWVSVHDIGAGDGASDVEKLSFVTVGQQIYIIIGFNLSSTAEKAVSVYCYNERRLEEKARLRCANYEVVDLDGDNIDEILAIVRREENGVKQSTAELYRISAYGKTQLLDTTQMAPDVTEYVYITKGHLGEGRTALYLDGMRGSNLYRPEILIYMDHTLLNLMYDGERSQYLKGYERWTFGRPCRDLDGDGVVEIPVQTIAPGYEREEKHVQEYFTEWYTYESGELKLKKTTYDVPSKGYLFTLPQDWIGRVSVEYLTNEDELVFYEYPVTGEENRCIFSIKTVTRQNYSGEAVEKGYTLLKDNGQILYVYRIYHMGEELEITPEQILYYFQLYK